jgi:hypothetical protein
MRTWKSPSSSMRLECLRPTRGFLLRDVFAQRLDLGGRDGAHELARHLGFEHAAHLEHLRASSTVGAATKAPRAGSRRTSLFCASWNSACRTSVRETPKWSASFCSASLVPGCSDARRWPS